MFPSLILPGVVFKREGFTCETGGGATSGGASCGPGPIPLGNKVTGSTTGPLGGGLDCIGNPVEAADANGLCFV